MTDQPKLVVIRKVPARTKRFVAEWCKSDFMEMTPRFRQIRSKSKKPMDTCGICKHKFEDGEMMGLACFEEGGNKTVCQSCCQELLNSVKGVTDANPDA